MKKFVSILMVFLIVFSLTACNKKDSEEGADELQSKLTSEELTEMLATDLCELATLELEYNNVGYYYKDAEKLGEKPKQYWISYNGYMKLGINVSEVKAKVNGTKVTITMPKAKVLDVANVKSNQRVSYESKDGWKKGENPQDYKDQALEKGKERMRERAEASDDMLKLAQNRAKQIIKNYIDKIGEQNGAEYTITWVIDGKKEKDNPKETTTEIVTEKATEASATTKK